MSNMISSITDIPRDVTKGDKDSFGIEPFEKGLVRFLKNTNTPITVALQGEWGSGKTSLMNSLQQSLSGEISSPYHAVWLNTWEYGLMKDAQTTLIDIISALTDEVTCIANIDESEAKKLSKKVMGIGGNLLKFAGKTALNTMANGVGDVVEQSLATVNEEKTATIGQIRDELETIIKNCIEKDNKNGFIFFIDDLDRIDPPIAVELLELLKNIFTLKNCVFVLAIDYDVVIKGLEPKFGKLTASNEREFRSFFDKIIQVPFSMPVGSYQPSTFLQDSLSTIQYLNEKQLNDEALISQFTEISSLTVGSNPRALKRLLNSISLISCINAEKQSEDNALNDDLELLINFALVSIQVAYPTIYRLLVTHADFDKWDESIAVKLDLKPLNETTKQKLSSIEEFDEEWEQILFRICETDYFLKKRALNISRLLNLLRTLIAKKGLDIEETIDSIISLSSVTSLETLDEKKPKTKDYSKYLFQGKVYNKGRLVHAVVKAYVAKNPDISFDKLKEVFPDELQGRSGVFTTKEEAEEIFNRTGRKRNYIKENELIQIADNIIATCTQWGTDNIPQFVKTVNKLGTDFKISGA